MSPAKDLEEGGSAPASRGFVDGDWYVEETTGAVRQSFRINKILHEEQTEFQRLAVYDTPFFGRVLTLDDIVMLTERDEFIYHEMLIHPALCSIPQPREVLIIGGGDAGCLRETLKHPNIERVIQVDIDRRVTEVASEHYGWVAAALDDPRSEVRFEDGVAFLKGNPGRFDLVVIDSTDPQGFALELFMSRFYRYVIQALKPDGKMTAQTESPYWSTAMVGAIYDELGEVFTCVDAYLASVPTYASGTWTMALAGNSPRGTLIEERANTIANHCRYYNAELHNAAFALPTCVRDAIRGENHFAQHDARVAHSAPR